MNGKYLGTTEFNCPYCGQLHDREVTTANTNETHVVKCVDTGCRKEFVVFLESKVVTNVWSQVYEINPPMSKVWDLFTQWLVLDGLDVNNLDGIKLESIQTDFLDFVHGKAAVQS